MIAEISTRVSSIKPKSVIFSKTAQVIILLLALAVFVAEPVLASTTTVVVKPSTLASTGWGFLLETGSTGVGDFTAGPLTPPLGSGSVHFTTASSSDGVLIGRLHPETRLDSITRLEYSTFQALTSTSTVQVASLQFNIDNDVTDSDTTWKGRLVFEPYYSETITNGVWQTWDTLTQGRWWGTHASISGTCSISTPCTWTQVLTAFPDIGIGGPFGSVLLKVGSGAPAGFDGNADALVIGINGNDTVYDFEPETACTSVCYVDAVNGNDAFGGDTPASAKKTIQAGIDAVSPGGQVRVLPGTYSETASGRTLTSIGGTYTFGLFIGDAKSGITIMGVDAGDNPITSYASVLATINTNATNNFGPSGIFVEGDNVTISGVRIGTNSAGQNKTIEVIGDNFTLKYSDIADLYGSVYINDFRFDTGTNTSHVQAYRIEGNNFQDGVSLDLANGAGFSGPVSSRVIKDNDFTNSNYWPSISFNGSNTGVEWFVYSVGGAQITGNDFTNTSNTPDDTSGHIRARGTYDNTQFDWESYWKNNTYNKATITLIGSYPPFDVRTYSYTSGSYTFNDVRRIGVTIQGEVDRAVATDTVLVNQGTYVEQVVVPKTLQLVGEDGLALTTIQMPSPQAGDRNLVTVTGSGINVEITGFTVAGPATGPLSCAGTLAGIIVRDDASAHIHQNHIKDIADDDPGGSAPFSGCQHGIGILVGRVALGTNGSANIHDNLIDGYQKGGIVVSNSSSSATINNNTVTGFGAQDEIAQNGIQVSGGAVASVTGNTVTNHLCDHATCGPDPVNASQSAGVLLFDPGASTVVSGNTISNNDMGVYNYVDTGGAPTINGNTLVGNRYEGIFLDQGTASVTNNELSGTSNIGIVVVSFDATLYGTNANSHGTVTNNKVKDALTAIRLIDESTTDTFVPTITANWNSLSGNTAGMDNTASTGVDGEKNWWGSASGPSGVGPGSGVSVSANVDFDPWLCDGTDTLPAIGFQPNATLSPCVGNLAVTKIVDWSGFTPDNAQTFQICIQGPSYPLGTETGACQTADFDGGALTWTGLIPGNYTVTETDPGASWSTSITGSPAAVTIGQTATATVTNTRATPKIAINKQGPVIAIGGGPITYTYLVTNPGNVPLSDVSVSDNKCSPVSYQSGDDGDSLLETGETWTFQCTYTPAFTSYSYLKNTADASGKFNSQTVTASDDYKLYPFTLRKKVYLYWNGHHKNVPQPADNTVFTVEVYKNNQLVQTVTIAQNAPANLWLSGGIYKFKEVNLPLGYLAGNSEILINTHHGRYTATFENIITTDLHLDKTGPATAHKGQVVTYVYTVTNSGPASVTPTVTDNKCRPVYYVSGDTDHDGRIDPNETWIFNCKYKVTSNPGTVIVNIAIVRDASRPIGHYGGDRNLYNDIDMWTMRVIP